MTPKDFYTTYLPFAQQSEQQTKVPALFTLAQAALESAWGAKASGQYNFFGIKDTEGNGELVLTTEYNKRTGWQKIKQWFRSYKTPADGFTDHGKFLVTNPRYAAAFLTTDPVEFARAVSRAGYATDPKYFEKIANIIMMLEKFQ